jgi:hypothetical protein
MPIRRGFFGGAVNILPTVTIGATTDFTESRGVFNATVNGNTLNTTVVFHYSTASNFSSFTSVAGSGSGTGSFSSSATVTGLAVNTLYYVRAVATSSVGAVTSGSTSFTTWKLITVSYGSSTTLTVPTVSGVNPAALVNVLIVGGGGGGAFSGGGGGGGGYRYTTSRAFNGTSGALTITIGGGGTAGNDPNLNGGAGGTTTLSGTNMTSYSADGGTGGVGSGSQGGNVGTGDNPAYTGGLGFTDGGKVANAYGGGGAGVAGYGASGTTYGAGNGGAGTTINGWGLGSGGGGGSQISDLPGTHGSPTSGYGLGGNGGYGVTHIQAGSAGLIVFSYYGP